MQTKICFASIDVEGDINENLGKILDFFEGQGIPLTLFTVGEVLQRMPDLFRKLAKDHEIASHGFTHRFWNTLDGRERNKELDGFIALYQNIFGKKPAGFRAPSHVMDQEGIGLLEKKGFLYDSSVVPRYPPFKKYRGYKGRKPLMPHFPEGMKILEIPVRGQLFGVPLAGSWIAKLPVFFYEILFFLYCPKFITLSIHSWDSLKNFKKIIKILKNKRYQFLNGEQIYQNYR